jgi:hypothetical protein
MRPLETNRLLLREFHQEDIGDVIRWEAGVSTQDDNETAAQKFLDFWQRLSLLLAGNSSSRRYSHPTNSASEQPFFNTHRWDEKAGLRRDAIRSQVIDALEAQEIKERLCPTIVSSLIAERKAIGTQDSVRYAAALTRGMQTMQVMRCMQDTKIFRRLMNSSDLFPVGAAPQNGLIVQ